MLITTIKNIAVLVAIASYACMCGYAVWGAPNSPTPVRIKVAAGVFAGIALAGGATAFFCGI